MALYPLTPVPSMVSAPEILDDMLSYRVDQGYEVRRAKYSRPRRRWSLEYLGKTTDEMRQIRDFLQQHRLGALDFTWQHPTAFDTALFVPATPQSVFWRHALFTGQWIVVYSSPNPTLVGGAFQVTYIDPITVTLNGTVASGDAGVGEVGVVVPHAVGRFQEGTMASPTTLIGPEQVPYGARRSGYFSFSVQIEETF